MYKMKTGDYISLINGKIKDMQEALELVNSYVTFSVNHEVTIIRECREKLVEEMRSSESADDVDTFACRGCWMDNADEWLSSQWRVMHDVEKKVIDGKTHVPYEKYETLMFRFKPLIDLKEQLEGRIQTMKGLLSEVKPHESTIINVTITANQLKAINGQDLIDQADEIIKKYIPEFLRTMKSMITVDDQFHEGIKYASPPNMSDEDKNGNSEH